MSYDTNPVAKKDMSALEYYKTLPRQLRRQVYREMKKQEKHGEQPHLARAMLKLKLITSYSDM